MQQHHEINRQRKNLFPFALQSIRCVGLLCFRKISLTLSLSVKPIEMYNIFFGWQEQHSVTPFTKSIAFDIDEIFW